MDIEKTKEIIRGFFKAVNEGDAQKVLEVYYHPDIRYWIPGNSNFQLPGLYGGKVYIKSL